MLLKAVFIDRHNLFLEVLCDKIMAMEEPLIAVEACYNNGINFLEELDNLKSDIIFLELNLPSITGIQLIPKIKRFKPEAQICILSAYSNTKFVKEVFQNGADGYFLKQNTFQDFTKGIEEVIRGYRHIAKGVHITPSMQSGDIQEDFSDAFEDGFYLKNKLTKREQEILKLIVLAKNNKEIGKELFISDQTVGVHRKNIMRKLGVRNSISLIRFAMDNKLV